MSRLKKIADVGEIPIQRMFCQTTQRYSRMDVQAALSHIPIQMHLALLLLITVRHGQCLQRRPSHHRFLLLR
jgi:hypothetical protein